jgi:hypothetical protein
VGNRQVRAVLEYDGGEPAAAPQDASYLAQCLVDIGHEHQRKARDCRVERIGWEVEHLRLISTLKLDQSTISRRVKTAINGGFLRNLEDRKRQPTRLVVGDPLPDEQDLLPEPGGMRVCADARGDMTLFPPEAANGDGRTDDDDLRVPGHESPVADPSPG